MNPETKQNCNVEGNHVDSSNETNGGEEKLEIKKVQIKLDKISSENEPLNNLENNSNDCSTTETEEKSNNKMKSKKQDVRIADESKNNSDHVENSKDNKAVSCKNKETKETLAKSTTSEPKNDSKSSPVNEDKKPKENQENDITSTDSVSKDESKESDKTETIVNSLSPESQPDSTVTSDSSINKSEEKEDLNIEPMDIDTPSNNIDTSGEKVTDEKSEETEEKNKMLSSTLDISAQCATPEMIVSDNGPQENPKEPDLPKVLESKSEEKGKETKVISEKDEVKKPETTEKPIGTPTNKEGKDKKEHSKKKKSKTCEECGAKKHLKLQLLFQGKTRFLCSDACFKNFKLKQKSTKPAESPAAKDKCAQCMKDITSGFYPSIGERKPLCSEECIKSYHENIKCVKKCSQCKKLVEAGVQRLTWETMEFCNEDCLGKYQSFLGSHCTCCQTPVQQASLGKYCVCFGADIRQFCSGSCLEEFKKGLKVCTFCQKDLSSGVDGFLAPVGEKSQFKDFCTQRCMERYEIMNNTKSAPPVQDCAFCKKQGTFKIQVKHEEQVYFLCCENCVAGFRCSKNIKQNMCETCYNFFDFDAENEQSLLLDAIQRHFCTKECMTLFVLQHRKIVPCVWCKVKKYNFDMIEKADLQNQQQVFCSLNCLSLFRVNVNATSSKCVTCDHCSNTLPAQYHLTMSDGSIRNFCNYQCVLYFQNQFTNVPALTTTTSSRQTTTPRGMAPGIVSKLVPQKLMTARQPGPPIAVITTKPQAVSTSQVVREVIVRPPAPKPVKNKTVSCKPVMQTKGVSCKPHPCHKAVQTDESPRSIILPIPVPIYVPTPVHLFSRPVPCPLPFPVPIPVPIILPTSKESSTQVIKHLKDIQDKIPSNPYEAELLMMAEMVAENGSKGKSTIEETEKEEKSEPQVSKPVPNDGNEPDTPSEDEYVFKDSKSHKKRHAGSHSKSRKKSKVEQAPSESVTIEDANNPADQPETYTRLKYTFGVNAWKHWVLQKNTQLETGSQSSRKFKLFKTDLLQLPPDELNYSLCLFVKEVRKPNGDEYGAGSIYYLCLGIQQYLFENGRIDNIFTDPYYEKFTECLNDVLASQEDLLAIEGYTASRIEEEILWESKQLGAHSPHVLLNTLMYFNTKYFKLKTVEDHTRLSFTHITKHWRKSSSKGGTRNVLLRYYPPLVKDFPRRYKQDNTVYEQVENVVNPLRCPVKLYEFYISKCPESVKLRNDSFYLYPERSCVPDSPVWYSTQPLGQEAIAKMIQRIRIVREINDL